MVISFNGKLNRVYNFLLYVARRDLNINVFFTDATIMQTYKYFHYIFQFVQQGI